MNLTLPAIALIIAGLAAISNFIIAKKPEAAAQLDKLKPISGWVGVGLLIIGLVNFFGLTSSPAYWNLYKFARFMPFLTMMAILLYAPVCILLGFMQGYGLIDKYVLNKAKEKGSAGASFDKFADSAYDKIVKFTTPVGFVGIFVGFILLLIQFRIIL